LLFFFSIINGEEFMSDRDGGGGGYGKGAGRGRSGDGVRAQQCGDAPSRRNPYAVLQSHAFASRLRSAYASVGEPHLTTFHGGFHGTVDYIMFDSASFVPRSYLRTPTVAELAAEGCLPSARRPSDHVPIACDLEWVGSGHAGPGACDDAAKSCRYDERDGEDGHSAASGSGPWRGGSRSHVVGSGESRHREHALHGRGPDGVPQVRVIVLFAVWR